MKGKGDGTLGVAVGVTNLGDGVQEECSRESGRVRGGLSSRG